MDTPLLLPVDPKNRVKTQVRIRALLKQYPNISKHGYQDSPSKEDRQSLVTDFYEVFDLCCQVLSRTTPISSPYSLPDM